METKYLSPKAFAEVVGLHKNTVLRYIKEGKIKAYRLNRKVIRIPLSEAELFLAGKRRKGRGRKPSIDFPL